MDPFTTIGGIGDEQLNIALGIGVNESTIALIEIMFQNFPEAFVSIRNVVESERSAYNLAHRSHVKLTEHSVFDCAKNDGKS